LSYVDGKGVLIESVIVDETCRGKGYGRLLMTESEKTAKSLGFVTIYLSTKDKDNFYRHLGYEDSNPVSSLGENSKRLTSEQVIHFALLI